MAYQKIVYQGQDILLFDHTGLRGQALLESIQEGMNIVLESGQEDLLSLADFTGTYANDEVMSYLQSEDSKLAAKKTKKMATVGVTGIKGIFMNMYNAFTRVGARNFPDRESAKEYLFS